MKKLMVVGVGVLLSLVLYASIKKPLYVTILTVDAYTKGGSSNFTKKLENALKVEVSKIPGFKLTAELTPQTASEIKLAILQGQKFPPQIRKSISADLLVIVKRWAIKDKLFLSIAVIDETTGEIRGVKTFPLKKISEVKRIFRNLIESIYRPLPPEANLTVSSKKYYVSVLAEGLGRGPSPIARRIALIDAKRRAVEKALGAIIDLKIVPDTEISKIVSVSEGSLKYKIVREGKKKNFYSVTISAEVLLPSSYVKQFPPSPPIQPPPTGYHSLVVTPFSGVQINWEKGYILADGKGEINNSILLARRAAIVEAQGESLRALEGIRIKREERAGDLGMEYHLRGLVKGGTIVREWIDKNYYHILLKVPIYGVRGLTGLITDSSIEAPFSFINQNKKFNPSEVDGYTGIVVDATGTGLVPSMIVELYDENGAPLYNEHLIDPEQFRNIGMAAFVVKEGSELKLLRESYVSFPIFIASRVDYIYMARRNNKRYYYSSYTYKPFWRYRRRQGDRPLRIRAISLPKGKRIRTGAIISTRSGGKRLRRIARQLFRTARVVIITDAQVGGTEGEIFDPRFMGALW